MHLRQSLPSQPFACCNVASAMGSVQDCLWPKFLCHGSKVKAEVVSPPVQRKLAAILSADVAGFSGLMQADEAATHAAVKRMRLEFVEPAVAQHGGRLFKLMGDGLLAE